MERVVEFPTEDESNGLILIGWRGPNAKVRFICCHGVAIQLIVCVLFFIHNLKIYNLLTYIYIYKNDTIGSMIGMATLNGLLTCNNTDTNGYN